MRAGTRGLVTTLEERTGSVGDSSAPSRNDSVQVRSVMTCVATAMMIAVSGIARTSLRSGRRQCFWSISPSTSRPSRNRITIRATVASPPTNDDRASRWMTSVTPGPSPKPIRTNSAVSDRKLRPASPDTSAPITSRHPRARSESVEACALRREQQRHLHVCDGHAIRVSCLREERRGDHGAGQVAGVAGRRWGV